MAEKTKELKERRCWMCRRTAQEVWDDLPRPELAAVDSEAMLFEFEVGDQKIWLCEICDQIVYFLTRHNGDVNEYDIVLFEDLWIFRRTLIEALESLDENFP